MRSFCTRHGAALAVVLRGPFERMEFDAIPDAVAVAHGRAERRVAGVHRGGARLPRARCAARARVQALVCDSTHYFLRARAAATRAHRCAPTKSENGRCLLVSYSR